MSARRNPWLLVGVSFLLIILVSGGLKLLIGDEKSTPLTEPASGPSHPPFTKAWTKLPLPPEVRDGAAWIWAGTELVAWGGCDPEIEDDCNPTATGFAYDPVQQAWRTLPEAPAKGSYALATWTGKEILFIGLRSHGRLAGQAYVPTTNSWHRIATAPIRWRHEPVHVWTGSELIVWGGGYPNAVTARNGAAYDPAADTWRKIADSPQPLTHATGVWTGDEMIAFGSLLDGRNRASTRKSVGAAYDPVADRWDGLPRSKLSPQATSAVWIENRMVAWDYLARAQEFDPGRDTWGRPARVPFRFSECYPDSEVTADLVFAFYCGEAALYEPETSKWSRIHGGPLARKVRAHGRAYKLWRFAHLTASEESVYLAMQGITVNRRGVPCYGCPGSPLSLWAYTPVIDKDRVSFQRQ